MDPVARRGRAPRRRLWFADLFEDAWEQGHGEAEDEVSEEEAWKGLVNDEARIEVGPEELETEVVERKTEQERT